MFKLRITADLGFEVWQDIPGYEGLYQASTYGRIRSVERYVLYKRNARYYPSVILKPVLNSYGYYVVSLSRKLYSVHRLIALTFLSNPNNYPQVNHKDEVKSNNYVSNLEYCTQGYNNLYGTRIERAKTRQKNHPKRSKPILQYDLNGNIINSYPSIKEAARETGFSDTHIGNCCSGKERTAYKYIWRYA